MTTCYFCQHEIEIGEFVGRRDECPHCGRDLHCCYQCNFFEPAYNNECRETQAERVVEKDRSNFCGYFRFGRRDKEVREQRENVLSQLDALFKKKG